MTSIDELVRRMTDLEERLTREEGLRASVDRDLGDVAATLRAQHHTIQALAITSSAHNMKLTDVERRIATVEQKLDRLMNVPDQLAAVVGMLTELIRRENEADGD